MIRLLLLGSAWMIGATAIPAGAWAQAASSADLARLDTELPGTLVNDPSRIDWQSYGAELEAEAVVDKSIPGGGAARRFTVKRAGEFIYLAGANIPLTKSVRRGEVVTLGFYARTIKAKTSDGRGVLRVRFQQNKAPYPGFGEKTLTIGPQWQWYEVTAKAERKLTTKDGIVALQFGRTRQTIEIGQAIVVTGAAKIAKDDGAVSAPAAKPAQPAMPEPMLPEPLIGAGQLLNNPQDRAWKMGGTAGTWEEREDKQIWLAHATRFTVREPNEDPSALYASIEIAKPIAKGDMLLIAVAARSIESDDPQTRAIVASLIQGTAPPYESFAKNRFAIAPKWQLIRIKTKAPRSYSAGGAELALYFAGARQTLDIGPVYVIKTQAGTPAPD